MSRTEALFRDDAYLAETEATVLALHERGILLDRTIFYATSGGQPGDVGRLIRADGLPAVAITATVTGDSKDDIVHVPADDQALPRPGERVRLSIDWERRYRLMRMHTACHLLSVVCPFPVTGAAVGEEESRIDFDIPDSGVTKEEVTRQIMELVAADHPVFTRLITDAELAAQPGLVKSKNVRPPAGGGVIRLVCIGEAASVDSQPCGGTHGRNTGGVGAVHIGKIEKKGRENRRFRLRFGPLPEG